MKSRIGVGIIGFGTVATVAPGTFAATEGALLVDTDLAVNGALAGSGPVTKVGTGNWTLSASNSYTGGTSIRGGTLNVWESDYNDTITGHRGWVYPEFKGGFANVRWLQLETGEGLITVVPENIPFVQVLTPAQPPDGDVGGVVSTGCGGNVGESYALRSGSERFQAERPSLKRLVTTRLRPVPDTTPS